MRIFTKQLLMCIMPLLLSGFSQGEEVDEIALYCDNWRQLNPIDTNRFIRQQVELDKTSIRVNYRMRMEEIKKKRRTLSKILGVFLEKEPLVSQESCLDSLAIDAGNLSRYSLITKNKRIAVDQKNKDACFTVKTIRRHDKSADLPGLNESDNAIINVAVYFHNSVEDARIWSVDPIAPAEYTLPLFFFLYNSNCKRVRQDVINDVTHFAHSVIL